MQTGEFPKDTNAGCKRLLEERTAELARVNEKLGREIEEHRQVEDELRLYLRFLDIERKHTEMVPLLCEYVSEIRAYSRCDAAGIRVLDGNLDISYMAYEGFSRPFYELECPLYLKPGKSVFINTVSEGYRTVALFSFGGADKIRGLIHLADHRENMLGANMVKVLEKAAMQLGAAIWRPLAQNRLRQSEDRHLRRKTEAIGTLAGGIANDLNNILQPVVGYAEMALNELPSYNPLRHDLEQVLTGCRRAEELVRQILGVFLSSADSQRTRIEIGSLVKQTLKQLRSSLPASIEMRDNIEMGVALADLSQIRQVLMNLCTNAAQAMNGKGVLEVTLSNVTLTGTDLTDRWMFYLKPGPYLKLCVSDTGCGIDKENLERIFDPYFTTREVGKGGGLGLAVVNGIVKRHGGAINVQSIPGKGSTFCVYIPAIITRQQGHRRTGG